MNDAEPKDSSPGAAPAPGGSLGTEASDPAGMAARAGRPDAGHASLDIHDYIGVRLREVYQDVANQPIPDRFLDLMRQLDAK